MGLRLTTNLQDLPKTRLTKLAFIGRLPAGVFQTLLTLAKTEVSIDAIIKQVDWATPEADGTAIDVADPRTIAAVQGLVASTILTPEQGEAMLAPVT